MRTKRVEVKIRGRMLVAKWVDHCPSDETGRRAGFKIQWGQPRVGSTPTSGTNNAIDRWSIRDWIKRLTSRSWNASIASGAEFLAMGYTP